MSCINCKILSKIMQKDIRYIRKLEKSIERIIPYIFEQKFFDERETCFEEAVWNLYKVLKKR